MLEEDGGRVGLVVFDAGALFELLLLRGGGVIRWLGEVVFCPVGWCGRRLLRRIFAFGAAWLLASFG